MNSEATGWAVIRNGWLLLSFLMPKNCELSSSRDDYLIFIFFALDQQKN
jgi:hypothetical protein